MAGLLGYDKDALLTPAWDKIVYHVRLPSTSAEISSLQLDELEYDRAIDTVLVIAAPAWMTRSRVLAELPYERFDNAAWQHLWADGTLTEDELFRFHRLCYEDDILCQKIGEHVFAKLRAPSPVYSAATPPPGYLEPTLAAPTLTIARPMEAPQARLAAPAAPPAQFVETVRAIFEQRGYAVSPGVAENTLLLQRQGRTAMVAYQYHKGMIDIDPVQRALAAATAAGATQTFVVTNGHFTLQAEDFAAAHPVDLIDGDELAELATRHPGLPNVSENGDRTATLPSRVASNGTAPSPNGDRAVHLERTEVRPTLDAHPPDVRSQEHEARSQDPRPSEARSPSSNIHFTPKMAPVDAEIVGGEGAV